MQSNMFRSSRLFLYLGFGLILLSLVSSTIKTEVNAQSQDFPDYENFNIGFLFAPVIGSYGLASLALGIAEVSMPKKKTLVCLLPIFSIIYIWTSVIVWMAIQFGFDAPFWWVYAGIHFIPSIMVSVIGVIQFAKKEYMDRIFKNNIIRKAACTILIAIPLLFVAALWLFYLTL